MNVGKEPATGNHQVAAMQALMNGTFAGGLENFEDNVEEFKQQVSRFESRFQVEVHDTVLQAVLKNNAPAEIRDKIELRPTRTSRRATAQLPAGCNRGSARPRG